MTAARVTIARRDGGDARERQVVIALDGEKVATLMFGGSVTREVAPGRHRLRAHNTLVWKTIDCDLRPGDHAAFEVANRPGFGTWAMLSLLGTGPIYLRFQAVPSAGGSPRQGS